MEHASKSIDPDRTFTNSAGQKIFVRIWEPAIEPKAIIAICPGFNAHSGLYEWAATQFVADGFLVYAVDLRGRGRSEGERFYVEKIDDYVADLSTVIDLARADAPGLPLFLLGHSAGGVVACVFTLEHQCDLAGLVCESFAFQIPAPDIAIPIIEGVGRLLPHAPLLRLKNEDFSRDPSVVHAMNMDPLIAHEAEPAGTAAALAHANDRLKHSFSEITLPVLILHGTADKVTRPSGSQFFFDTAGSLDKTLKLYPGHVHDLLADFGKDEVMQEIITWIDDRLAPRATAIPAPPMQSTLVSTGAPLK